MPSTGIRIRDPSNQAAADIRLRPQSIGIGSTYIYVRGLLEKYPTFGREKETGLLGALDT